MMKCYYILISGRVQGVSFRQFVYQKALVLKIKGFVRNLANGKVEVIIEGREEALAKMIEACKRGPLRSHITHIFLEEQPYTEEFKEFRIRK